MPENRKRGVKPHEEGLKKLEYAKATIKDENGTTYSQERIAEKAGISLTPVKNFFSTNNKNVDKEKAIAICNVFGLNIEEIVDPKDLYSSVKEKIVINWHPICHQVLAQQQKQQRIRRKITERGFELNIFVPLGLVERREQQRRSGKVSQDEIY